MAQTAPAFDISQSIAKDLKRLNLITGKGGVGRSTLAAVLAKTSAAAGKKTLLAELEDDHGADSVLASSFNQKHFQDEPTELESNLYGVRLSPFVGQSLFLNSFLKISAISNSILSNHGVKWFLEGAPAFREMGFFYHLLLQLRKKDFECLVLDLPATGHVIGLAKLPRILLRLIPIGPIAERLKEGQSYFYDEAHTAAWVVTLPQTLPVSEAIELKNALVAETIPMGGFILNRAPFNPFHETEEQQVETTLGGDIETLGVSASLERIRRLAEAEQKLCAEATAGAQTMSVFIAEEANDPLLDLTSTKPLRRLTC